MMDGWYLIVITVINILISSGYHCQGNFRFVTEPQDVCIETGMDAFFPCVIWDNRTNITVVPTWNISSPDSGGQYELYHPRELPAAYFYNGSGLVVINPTIQFDGSSIACCYQTFSSGTEQPFGEVCSSNGELHIPCAVGQTSNLTPDENYTVPYNSNENITYHCEVESGQEVVWTIFTPQQRPYIQLQTSDENEYGLIIDTSLNESRLTVTQMARNQFRELLESPRLEIGCFPFGRINIFPTRTITAFGPLEPPSNIRFSDSDNQLTSEVQLSWTAPDPEVPSPEIDILYHVQVTNLSSGLVEEFSTREESIVFTPETGTFCSEFNLTVFASNEQVGNSSVVSILENIPISPNVSIISDSIETVVDLTGGVSIAIKFHHASVCSDNYPVQYYTMMLENGMEILPPRIANCNGIFVCATINKTDIPTLSVDQVVNFTVSACSNVTCRSTETLTAYTTGVQQPTVYFVQLSTYVLVTCNFANGSRAIGCLFNFTITSGDSELYNFSRDSKENSKLCNGGSQQACICITAGTERFVESYSTIEAFTLEEDGVTRSRISVPVIRRNVSDTPEMIAVCNLTMEPLGQKNAGAIIGGTLGGGVLLAVIATAIVIIIVVLGLLRKARQKQSEPDVVPIRVAESD